MDNNTEEIVLILQSAEDDLQNSTTSTVTSLRLSERPASYLATILDEETGVAHYTAQLFYDPKPEPGNNQAEVIVTRINFSEPICESIVCSVCQGTLVSGIDTHVLVRSGGSRAQVGIYIVQGKV